MRALQWTAASQYLQAAMICMHSNCRKHLPTYIIVLMLSRAGLMQMHSRGSEASLQSSMCMLHLIPFAAARFPANHQGFHRAEQGSRKQHEDREVPAQEPEGDERSLARYDAPPVYKTRSMHVDTLRVATCSYTGA